VPRDPATGARCRGLLFGVRGGIGQWRGCIEEGAGDGEVGEVPDSEGYGGVVDVDGPDFVGDDGRVGIVVIAVTESTAVGKGEGMARETIIRSLGFFKG